MNILKPNEVIYVELPNGDLRKITHAELIKEPRRKKYNTTPAYSIKRAISLFQYAKANGRYPSGAKAGSASLSKMHHRIQKNILSLPIPEQQELLDILAA